MANPPNKCECEHDAHFFQESGKHPYGREFEYYDLIWIKTPFSSLRVCANCLNTCMKIYAPKLEAE